MVEIKILFVGREKQDETLSIIVERQIESLYKIQPNLNIKRFIIKGNGIASYLRSYFSLRKESSKVDIIHANYSFTAVLAILAKKKNCRLVVSFMGDDVFSNSLLLKASRRFVINRADQIIVKSDEMKSKLCRKKNIHVIPNGVNLSLFRPLNSEECKYNLKWDLNKIHVLFPASIDRPEKRFSVAQSAYKELTKKYSLELHILEDISPSDVVTYLNAADLVFLTSSWEGSSNITKESMACNTPVVSTNVGDTANLFHETKGYFISDHSFEDIRNKLEEAIIFHQNQEIPNGRDRIIQLQLDEKNIAKQVLNMYNKTL